MSGPDHYLTPDGLLVFTPAYHLERGTCCASGCRHCPYREPRVLVSDLPPVPDSPLAHALLEVARLGLRVVETAPLTRSALAQRLTQEGWDPRSVLVLSDRADSLRAAADLYLPGLAWGEVPSPSRRAVLTASELAPYVRDLQARAVRGLK